MDKATIKCIVVRAVATFVLAFFVSLLDTVLALGVMFGLCAGFEIKKLIATHTKQDILKSCVAVVATILLTGFALAFKAIII